MGNYDDFKDEFTEKYNKEELKEIEKLLDTLFDQDGGYAEGNTWEASVSIEKVHQLQETWYVSLSKENGKYDEEVNLTYANGIDSGTELVDYDLDGGGGVPPCKVISILDSVKLDREATQGFMNSKKNKNVIINWELAEQLFHHHKNEIMEIYKKESYDNYVTGGGTYSTKNAYKSKREILNDKGIFWNCIYKDIEVDMSLR